MLFALNHAEKSMPELFKSQASYTETICQLVQAQRMACLLHSYVPNQLNFQPVCHKEFPP